MKKHVLESGQIVITGLELEELREEGKGLITSTHGGCSGQNSDNCSYPKKEVEYGNSSFPSTFLLLDNRHKWCFSFSNCAWLWNINCDWITAPHFYVEKEWERLRTISLCWGWLNERRLRSWWWWLEWLNEWTLYR